MDEELVAIYRDAANDLKTCIENKVLSGVDPPNAEATIKRKGSSLPLVDTGEMFANIEGRVEQNSSGSLRIEAGIFEDAGEEVLEKAYSNEYGTKHIPERSFIRSTFDEEMDRISQEIFDKVFDHYYKKMKEY
jgi:hypothetical protein